VVWVGRQQSQTEPKHDGAVWNGNGLKEVHQGNGAGTDGRGNKCVWRVVARRKEN
jgi:hypothetical protein